MHGNRLVAELKQPSFKAGQQYLKSVLGYMSIDINHVSLQMQIIVVHINLYTLNLGTASMAAWPSLPVWLCQVHDRIP